MYKRSNAFNAYNCALLCMSSDNEIPKTHPIV